jgi:hypothetical protein
LVDLFETAELYFPLSGKDFKKEENKARVTTVQQFLCANDVNAYILN